MDKAYSRIVWQNQPSTSTALGATNLNKMDVALNEIDNRVIAHDTNKADKSVVNNLVQSITYNESNGVLTITKQNGTATTIDTKLEKLAVNFTYDSATQKLIITLDDGTIQNVDLSSLISQYEFNNSNTVSFTLVDGKVTANVVNGSITSEKLQPNYLADITVQAQTAITQANKSKRYAVGGVETGDTTDNAKYYKEQSELFKNQAKQCRDEAESIVGVGIASEDSLGLVKGGGNVEIDSTGDMWANSYKDKATEMTGQLIQCPVADDGLIEITKIEGASSQLVTSVGKNILPKTSKKYAETTNGVTFTPNSDGTVTISGTASADTDFIFFGSFTSTKEVFKVMSGVTYTLKPTGNASVTVYLCKTSASIAGAGANKVTFTPTEDTSIVYLMVRVASGTVLNNFIVYPQLEVGSTSTAYEPFTPNSPSVEDPAPITNASNFDLIACRTNVLPNKITNGLSSNGIVATVSDDGKILLNGIATGMAVLMGTFDTPLYWQGTYTLSLNNPTVNTGIRAGLVKQPSSAVAWSLLVASTSVVNSKVTKDITDERLIRFQIEITAGTILTNFELKPQIEVGSVATPYELYKGNKLNIPYELPAKEVPSTANWTFTRVVNGVTKYYVGNTIEKGTDAKTRYIKRLEKVVYNGSENWAFVAANTNTLRFSIDGLLNGALVSRDKIMCDKFKSLYGDQTDIEHVRNGAVEYPNAFVLYINKSRLTGWSDTLTSGQVITLLKTWLASNPITVWYELATPVITEIPDIFLVCYKWITNLFSNASVLPTITANFKSQLWSDSYIKDKAIEEAKSGADINNSTVTFMEATVDEDIVSGDKISTLFGKILKRFHTIATSLAAKFDKSNIVQTDQVNDVNKVPSAAVAYALGGEIDVINNSLANKVGTYVYYRAIPVSTQADLDYFINNLSTTLGISATDGRASYELIVQIGASGLSLSGGWHKILGHCVYANGSLYASQMKISYADNYVYYRKCVNSVWTEWYSPDKKYVGTYTLSLSGMTATNLSINKKGNRVTVSGILNQSTNFPIAQTVIFNIGEGFRPTANLQIPVETSTTGHNTMGTGLLVVAITGDVALIQKGSSVTQISFNFSYDVD